VSTQIKFLSWVSLVAVVVVTLVIVVGEEAISTSVLAAVVAGVILILTICNSVVLPFQRYLALPLKHLAAAAVVAVFLVPLLLGALPLPPSSPQPRPTEMAWIRTHL
jgi:hypothetical protein